MTFTYDQDNLYIDGYHVSTIRFNLGDRAETALSLSDEEIGALYTQAASSINLATSKAADAMAILWAKQPASRSVGDISISNNSSSNPYTSISHKFLMLLGTFPSGGFAANATSQTWNSTDGYGYSRFWSGQFGNGEGA